MKIMSNTQKLERILKEKYGMVDFEESTYDFDEDRPMLRDNYVVSLVVNDDLTIICGLENNGFLFSIEEKDMTEEEINYIIDEAYDYSFEENIF